MGLLEKLKRKLGREPSKVELLRAKLAKHDSVPQASLWQLQLVDGLGMGANAKFTARVGLCTRKPIRISYLGESPTTTVEDLRFSIRNSLAVTPTNGIQLFVGESIDLLGDLLVITDQCSWVETFSLIVMGDSPSTVQPRTIFVREVLPSNQANLFASKPAEVRASARSRRAHWFIPARACARLRAPARASARLRACMHLCGSPRRAHCSYLRARNRAQPRRGSPAHPHS
jgi:hypothetical protein